MTRAASIQWRKEVRELLPWWVATVVAMTACIALMRPDSLPTDLVYSWAVRLDRDFLLGVGLSAYAIGAVTLGALTIGQEYGHHTLSTLLTHPMSRGRMLLIKLVVLTIMLAAIGALAFGAWGSNPTLIANFDYDRIVGFGLLPLACGLFLAPWLSMLGRGSLAGLVFTLALPSLAWVGVASLRLPVGVFWVATLALAGIGAVMTWRTFLRLEAAGERQVNVDLSAWFSPAVQGGQASRAQNPVWLLVKKEVRLQQATFVVSGLYVAVCLAVVAIRRFVPDAFEGSSPLFVATIVNSGLVSLMAGAFASAEERRLGAAEWTALLPFAAWRQWLIKASVVVGLTFLLVVVPPTVLDALGTELGLRDGMEPETVVLLSIVALYISSSSTNGVRALLIAVPAIAVAALLLLEVLYPIARAALAAMNWFVRSLPIVEVDPLAHSWWLRHGAWWMTAGFALLLLWFGYLNHRTSDHSVSRLARQFGWLSAYVTAAIFILLLGSRIILRWLMVTLALAGALSPSKVSHFRPFSSVQHLRQLSQFPNSPVPNFPRSPVLLTRGHPLPPAMEPG